MIREYGNLTESECNLFEDFEWRAFHGFKSDEEVYSMLMSRRLLDDRNKVAISCSPEVFKLAEDPEWREFHGYNSVEEGRRAILGGIFMEYSYKSSQGVDVSSLKKILDENDFFSREIT